jgi:hypothetical protein
MTAAAAQPAAKSSKVAKTPVSKLKFAKVNVYDLLGGPNIVLLHKDHR